MSPFQISVIDAVKKIPAGKVVSYGQIAVYLGNPQAARAVGWILRGLDTEKVPWWRVINNSGRISIKGNPYVGASDQKKHLEEEHILVTENYEIDINKYRYFYPL
jgi:methylated-DNA-protein-cysteine methyltransferase related protein